MKHAPNNWSVHVFLALLLTAPLVAMAADEEPLRVEQAFRFEAAAAAENVEISWQAAPGYYLYKKRFGFASRSAGIDLGVPAYPDGEIHEDEFFGRSIIYRDSFTVTMPYTRSAGAGDTLELELKSQGCADLGLCYPPQTWTVSIDLPSEPDTEADSGLLALINKDKRSGEFLPADEAFRLIAQPISRDWVEVDWQIADGYYLYRHRLQFEATGAGQTVGEALIPDGKEEHDEFFGDVEIYYDSLTVRLPVSAKGGDPLQLKVGYQGCAEDGICYPPTTKIVSLDMGGPYVAGTLGPQSSGTVPVSEQDRLAGLIMTGALPWVVASFFGFGILLAFTPCVLPMVPILSSVIVGQGTNIGTRRAVFLSIAFVLAMSLTYTIAGVVVAMLGQNLQAAFQHPLILTAFAAVFVALALAMFGVYELQVPAALQTRLSEISQRQKGGTLWGAGVMGVLSALIVGPCVAAPLAAALIVIGQTGDATRGGLALFALSLGMGTPLLAFGASAGRLLPAAGPWMNAVKAGFGFLLLGVAIWMLERILPAAVTLLLWGTLALAAGITMGGLTGLGDGATWPRRFGKGAGLLAMLYGAMLLVGAATGGEDPLRPLASLTTTDDNVQHLAFRPIKSIQDLDRELAAADGRLAMLDFYADWCVDCKKMDRYSFSDPAVIAALDGMLLLKADVTANDDVDQALLKRFGIFGPPTIAFFDADNREVRGFRQVGFSPANEFSEHVSRFRGQAAP